MKLENCKCNELKGDELYQNLIARLRDKQVNIKSKKELIQLQLEQFYHVNNKRIRLMFIEDFYSYIKHVRKDEVETSDMHTKYQNVQEEFENLERSIRKRPGNDQTVNFIIAKFIEKLDTFKSYRLRRKIIDFTFDLVQNLHKMTAMNYKCCQGGGYVLYLRSLLRKESVECQEIKPAAIFAFTYDFNVDNSNSIS